MRARRRLRIRVAVAVAMSCTLVLASSAAAQTSVPPIDGILDPLLGPPAPEQLPGPPPPPPPVVQPTQRGPCPNADSRPGDVPGATSREALLCLVNAFRRSKRLRSIRANERLTRAAQRHATDMVRRRYFAHVSPAGTDARSRVAQAGYRGRSARLNVGENLSYGAGESASPRGTLEAWKRSRTHLGTLLKRSYREIGIGIGMGSPVSDQPDARTYVANFGSRPRP